MVILKTQQDVITSQLQVGLDWSTACPFSWKYAVSWFLWIQLSGFLHPQLPTALCCWRRWADWAAREECHVLDQAFIPVPTLLPGCCQHSLRNALGTAHQPDTSDGQGQNPQESACWRLQQQKWWNEKRHITPWQKVSSIAVSYTHLRAHET